MPTLNVCVEIYMNKKKKSLFKLQIFLFFSEAVSMYNKITDENTDNSATYKSKLKNTE